MRVNTLGWWRHQQAGWNNKERNLGEESDGKMSTNKRIPKRSIIGSRVSVRCKDGVWRIGLVTAMRSKEDGLIPMEKKFSVKIECSKKVEEFSENEMIGPGFLSAIPWGTELVMNQHVFVTHNGREVEGKVKSHNALQVNTE